MNRDCWLILPFRLRLLAGLFLCVFHSVLAAVTVTTQLDRATAMTGESLTLTVTIEGGTPQTVETFPAIPNISVVTRPHSQTIITVNGQTTARYLLNYSVTASQPGQYTIPTTNVKVDGKSYATQPVNLTVTKADPSTQNRYAFLRLNVSKQELYVGEVIPIELQLYVVNAENPQFPQFKSDGFIIHKQPQHTKSQAQVGNILYSVLTFRMSISAVKVGKLALGPAEMGMVLLLRSQSDPNDFFGPRYQRRPVTVVSPSVELNVLPLPTPAPPGFNGAIGTFSWTVSGSPTNLKSGDPITLKAIISGRGNLDALKLPDLSWPEFSSYQPNTSVSSADPLGIDGTKSFEQVVVPKNASVREIPALTFAFFDPERKAYATLTHAATPIKVAPGATDQNQPQIAKAETEDEPVARADIVHIKTDPGLFVALVPPLIQRPWFLLLQSIPLVGVISLACWRKRQDRLANNPRLRRKLEVQKLVESGLAELKHLAGANQADAFYALLFRLLQEQLGDRLDLPASAITEAALEDRLPRKGASSDLINRLHQLFQICNQARYAPTRSNAEFLSVASDLEKALNDLQQLPD